VVCNGQQRTGLDKKKPRSIAATGFLGLYWTTVYSYMAVRESVENKNQTIAFIDYISQQATRIPSDIPSNETGVASTIH
jgi:hypothetical protein